MTRSTFTAISSTGCGDEAFLRSLRLYGHKPSTERMEPYSIWPLDSRDCPRVSPDWMRLTSFVYGQLRHIVIIASDWNPVLLWSEENRKTVTHVLVLESPSVPADTKEMRGTWLATPNIYGLCIIHEAALYTSYSARHSFAFVLHLDMKKSKEKTESEFYDLFNIKNYLCSVIR